MKNNSEVRKSIQSNLTCYVQCLACLTALFLNSPLNADDAGQLEGAGYLNAWSSSVSAVKSYRIRSTTSSSGFSPDGSSVESKKVYVMRVDHARKKYLVLSEYSESSVTKDGKESDLTAAYAFGVDADEGWTFNPNGNEGMRRFELPTHVLLAQFGFPEHRYVGLSSDLRSYPPNANLEQRIDDYFSPARPLSFRMTTEGDASIVLASSAGEFDFTESWLISGSRFVPLNSSKSVKAKIGNTWTKTSSEQYEWEERQGLQLPTKVIGERLKYWIKPDGKRGTYTVFYDTQFQWESVNDDFEIDTAMIPTTAEILKEVRKSVKPGY